MAEISHQNDSNGSDYVDVIEMESLHGYHLLFRMSDAEAYIDFDAFAYEYAEPLRRLDKARCLADLILAWLVHGDATLHCPTYPIYLKVVIGFIAAWNGEQDHATNGYYSGGFENFPRRQFDPTFPDAVLYDSITRANSDVGFVNHPAFDSTTYEVARAKRQAAGWQTDQRLAEECARII